MVGPTHATGSPLDLARLEPGTRVPLVDSGLDSRNEFVLRNDADWEATWQRIHARRRPLPAAPAVDFARHMVVVVAMGPQRSGGYQVKIERAFEEDGKTVVVVRETMPGAGCIVTAALTSPVDIALLPARDGPVEFRREAAVRDCN